ncbi:hypothetical protein PSM36_1208 [Proteiniphilum saccharofermentans]|uniref:Uncharacterized protein n=1 Tax=Proteiniphilum saccharofermentans TaxID=1642647 RepID=A0A1R3T1X4_9BACT|nr:hypothetical protein PSM36_1208 [Proteiniphilum saccharofermentans]
MLLISSQEFTIGTIADNHFNFLKLPLLRQLMLLFNIFVKQYEQKTSLLGLCRCEKMFNVNEQFTRQKV